MMAAAAADAALDRLNDQLMRWVAVMRKGVCRAADGLFGDAAASVSGASALLAEWCEFRDRVDAAHAEARATASVVLRCNVWAYQACRDEVRHQQVRNACLRYDASTRRWREYLDAAEARLVETVLRTCASEPAMVLALPTPFHCRPPDGLF